MTPLPIPLDSFTGKMSSSSSHRIAEVDRGGVERLVGAAPREIPADTPIRLGVVFGIAVPLLYLIPISLITRYRITRERHAEISAALKARRAEQAEK